MVQMSPAQDGMTRRLSALHDHYAWEVNAAVAEGRDDLIARLADDYLRQALQLMATEGETACERADCTVCGSTRSLPPSVGWRGWLRRLLGPWT
jgi:hypothetical protein